MNSKFKFLAVLSAFTLTCALCGCTAGNENEEEKKPPVIDNAEVEISSALADKAEEIIANPVKGQENVPSGSTRITDKITISTAGNYFVSTAITGKKITVDCEGVTLYLAGAKLSNEKKVIESAYPLTITLLGENTVSNSNPTGSNAIDCTGDLIINGTGSLTVSSTKNGIKANSISVIDATLDITAQNDGLHAEVESYDTAVSAPTPSYDDGGYVYLDGADVTINSDADGIQADTFVYVNGGTLDITAGGGAPSASSQTLSGKGIKAGPIDWGADKTEIDWNNCLIHLKGADVDIDANDDAIHSDGEANVASGDITLATGDDAVHADTALNVGGGKINITESHEGFESFTVNILGGEINLTADDDGINAGGGADSSGFGGGDGGNNPWAPRPPRGTDARDADRASINISGGKITVNSVGDGLDSNGNITVSGGEIYVNGPTAQMDAPIDFDGTGTITGGIVIAVGSNGMAQNFGSSSTQGSILYNFNPAGSGKVSLANGDGEIVSFTPAKQYSSVLISCPEIVDGATYTVNAGGKSISVTMNGLIYGNGSHMGGR